MDGRCPMLRSAQFANCRELTAEAAAHVASCPNLETAGFSYCDLDGDAAVAHLAVAPLLRRLPAKLSGSQTLWML